MVDAIGSGSAGSSGDPVFEIPQLKQDFLKILIENLKQQNPFTAANDSGKFLSDMAQFSNLEQTQNLNQSLNALLVIQSQAVAIQDLSAGSALIGKEVVYRDEIGETHSGVVESVRLGSNGVTLKIDGKEVPFMVVEEVREPAQSS